MKSAIKSIVRRLIRLTGFDLTRVHQEKLGIDPFSDMRHYLQTSDRPTIVDVGANTGQSIERFRLSFPKSRIHSFEPSPATFEKLRANCSNLADVNLWNYGVGSQDSVMEFKENSSSVMSSFLTPSTDSWGEVVKSSKVQMITLDAFAKQHGIEHIDILKSDAQGFDFEVFKGAKDLLAANRINLVYFEFIFSAMYEGLPSFHEVLRWLEEKNYALVALYDWHFQNELPGWADALFINKEFHQRITKTPS